MLDGIAIAKVGVDGSVPSVTVVSGSGLYSTFWRYMY
jgi:hypothetical protein